MNPKEQKEVLKKLCVELKLIDPIDFEHAKVYQDFGIGEYYLESDGRTEAKKLLAFTIDDQFNLLPVREYWSGDDHLLGDVLNYALGSPNIKNIIPVCNIFYNEGRGKYGSDGKSMVELLDDHIKFNRTKSAKNNALQFRLN